MGRISCWLCGVAVGVGIIGCAPHSLAPLPEIPAAPPRVDERRLLPTGKWLVGPESGSQVGSLPMNMILVRQGNSTFAITTDQGFRQALCSIRLSDGQVVSRVEFAKSPDDRSNGLYYGLACKDNIIYAAQGGHDSIVEVKIDEQGRLTPLTHIATAAGDFPAGLAMDDRGLLYVANNLSWPSSLSIYGTNMRQPVGQVALIDTAAHPTDAPGVLPEGWTTSTYPLAVAVRRDGSVAYVSSQRDGVVCAIEATDAKNPKLITRIPTGAHPIALLLSGDESQLFVANAQSDTVSIVDTKTDQVIGTVLLRPEIARQIPGVTPNGLALSPDQKTLFVTCGDMNAVAVVDVADAADASLRGYLPAGWYPTAVVAADDGRIFVANAKGTQARTPNPPAGQKRSSPLNLLEGSVTSIDVPRDDEQLAAATKRVLEANRLTPQSLAAVGPRANPLFALSRVVGRIEHVIYIIKENRTYDQVLGDLPQGNGKPEYVLFGREVTPNQHALAERFVLLDNFYDAGEVSGDGWPWSTQAMGSEYVIRNVPYSYSGRGRSFDYEGSNDHYPTGGLPATLPDGQPASAAPGLKEGAPPVPDVAEAPGGHLWDLALAAKLPFRNYGFFMTDGQTDPKTGAVIIPDNFPAVASLQPGGSNLTGVTDVDFRRFDLNYADSDAGDAMFVQTGVDAYLYPRRAYGSHKAASRFFEWHNEFKQMLAADPSGRSVPALMTVRFCNDHTLGGGAGLHSPRSMVADNDYAVGQLVQAVSHSPIWKHTAIFVIEDDAQSGEDHVDCHRSTCYVISPWIRAHLVDHTFQNTVSCLKTMELLLNLPPMCQYDAAAPPIEDWDTAPNNAAPYDAILPDAKILAELNPPKSQRGEAVSPEAQERWDFLMRASKQWDFNHEDRAPADLLNEIIWKTVKGIGSTPPKPVNGPVTSPATKREDD